MCAKAAELMGGLATRRNDNGAVLEAARKKLEHQKKTLPLNFLKQRKPAERQNGSMISSSDITQYVSGIADEAYNWVTDTVRPFCRELAQQMEKIGVEVLDDLCEDGSQLNSQRQKDYETGVNFLLNYGVDQDEIIKAELDAFPARRPFLEKIVLRVRDLTRVAILQDDIRHALDKEWLCHLLETSAYGNGKGSYKIFTAALDEKGCIRAFGKDYNLTDCAFGHYHDFAAKKLAEAVATRSHELAETHKAEVKKLRKELSAKTEDDVSPEDLLFGDSAEFDEKTSFLRWEFKKQQNGIRLRRSKNRLYVIGAVGSPMEALKAAQDQFDEPFVLMDHITSKDRRHLCPEKNENGKPIYDFNGFVRDEFFVLTCWVRTAFGECLPKERFSRKALPAQAAKPAVVPHQKDAAPQQKTRVRPVKPAGQLLTDQEFLFFGGLGEYKLVFDPGFKYEPRNEEGEPKGITYNITSCAVALVERKEIDGKTKLTIKHISTPELCVLLEASGAVVGPQYFEGMRGNSLPVALRLGISQAFSRLKRSEEASSQS